MARMDRWHLECIMNTAHRIRRQTAERLGCRPGEVLFSECLRMAWEYSLTGCGEGFATRIDSDKGYSTKSSAWRAARRLVGYEVRDDRNHLSIRYCDIGCTGYASDQWIEIDVLVREDMLSVYRAEDGWHWSVEWCLEDIQLPIIDVPSELLPDSMDTRHVSLREFTCWDGPRTEDGIPCLNPRWAA